METNKGMAGFVFELTSLKIVALQCYVSIKYQLKIILTSHTEAPSDSKEKLFWEILTNLFIESSAFGPPYPPILFVFADHCALICLLSHASTSPFCEFFHVVEIFATHFSSFDTLHSPCLRLR